MSACAITMVWNEAERLPRWIAHYGAALGRENLFVLDDGSDDGSTADLGPANVIRHARRPFDERARAEQLSRFATERLADYRTVVVCDVDELLIPFDGAPLAQALEAAAPEVVTAIGLDVMHKLDSEEPLHAEEPLLAQRRHARLNPTYCKPLVTRAPIRWRPGLHFSDHPIAFSGLLLLHLRYADLASGLARLAQLRQVEVLDQDVFSTHWRGEDAAFTSVLERADTAAYAELTRADIDVWEALLSARLEGSPPNAVERIRHLWDNHPSWFTLPDRLRTAA